MTETLREEPPPFLDYSQVALLAYRAWERAGCPAGREFFYWSEAEQRLRAAQATLAVPPPLPEDIRVDLLAPANGCQNQETKPRV